MKTKFALALLILPFLLILIVTPGCKSPPNGSGSLPLFNTSTNSIEMKAQVVTQIAVTKVLEKYPNATPKLQLAATDLQILEAAPVITVAEILEIIHRLPPDTFKDPSTGLYVELGVLFFTDELGAVAAQNPAQLRAAARGMRRGIETFLPKSQAR
jgi:hypothetical protein